MTTKKKINFDDIVYIPKLNSRTVDMDTIPALAKDIEEYGLFQDILVASHLMDDGDGGMKEKWRPVDGARRYLALKMVQERNPEAFARLVPGGKLSTVLIEGDEEALFDRSIKMNTQREQMKPWEIQAEIVRRDTLGQNQYDIAEILNIQQPRVNEYLSFKRLIPEVMNAWKSEIVHHHDLVKFATMSPEDQESTLAGFLAEVVASGGKKAKARKALKKAVKEKGNVREYANAGKPTRKKIASYVPFIARSAQQAEDEVAAAFYNGLAAGVKMVEGEVAFEKLSPAKTYTTKADAKAADKLEAEATEKAESRKARALAKAAKEKAAKPAKADKPKKAAKKAKAEKAEKPKKAAKKAAKSTKAKKSSKVAEAAE